MSEQIAVPIEGDEPETIMEEIEQEFRDFNQQMQEVVDDE